MTMKMLIAGKWVDRDKKIDVCKPYDGAVIDTVPAATAEDVDAAVAAAVKGFEEYKRYPSHQRIEILFKAAELMRDRQEEFARTIATEGSKTIREARGEVRRCINTITISAEEARRICGETLPFDSFPNGVNKKGFYYRFPIGVIAAITPFNDPLNLVAHKLGPAFAAGNAVVLKPATVTPLSALKLAEVLLEAGLPPMALQVITGPGDVIGDPLVADERIRMISFTGGVEAGLRITKKAGLKKIGMELGSNSPTIVMDDADIDPAVESCVSGAFWAVGQNCIGVQRLLVHAPVYDEFRDKFVARTKKYKLGPQLEEDTDMGPMITEGEAKRVESWTKQAVDKGGVLLTGGKRDYTRVQPTVFEKLPPGCHLDCDEVFGPVVSLYEIATLEQAIEKANSVSYGLHAAIFTNDVGRAFKAAYELDCGGVIINESTDYRLDMMPFGGVKQSGLGREGIKFALQEMTEPKVVCFNL
jgi:glyceraldehyde-3-phosphate dehydrogenase (NADP+)